mgnify:CR=1 FL=1
MTSILCIGNFGTGRKEQFDVAKLLCDLCCGEECKLIIGGQQKKVDPKHCEALGIL